MACCASGKGALGCASNPDCATDAEDRRRRRPVPPAASGPLPAATPAGSSFRTATLNDGELDQWLDLLADVFAGKTTRDYFELHWAADPSGSRQLENVFVAWAAEDATIVGSVRLYYRTIRAGGAEVRCAGVGEVATRSTHRGRGVASSLLTLAGGAMRERGLGLSVLHTSSAPGLYQKHGWTAVDASSLLLPVALDAACDEPGASAAEPGWSTSPLDVQAYAASYESLHPCYEAVSACCDGTVVRGKIHLSPTVTSFFACGNQSIPLPPARPPLPPPHTFVSPFTPLSHLNLLRRPTVST
jgi:GNAT superfamily N-acetyltransferase